ncbi:hypothetical protein BDV93DRAFT_605604 [Ceratobasidium sp. AG-I]|nr:hypothetical protein BDV93DRAFT_605604 [Ceratobasidium sp. AG-I]
MAWIHLLNGISSSDSTVALFEPGDGDVEVKVNGTSLETHRFILKRFNAMKSMLSATPDGITSVAIHRDEGGVDDFRNTFKIIYASVIEGPLEFDTSVLTSALRIATAYDYPALRNFAIQNLEKAPLSAIERISLAGEFGLTSWEGPAYIELCNRDEAITTEEASILGINAFARVANIREREQRRRGKEIDALAEQIDIASAQEPANTNNRAATSFTPDQPLCGPCPPVAAISSKNASVGEKLAAIRAKRALLKAQDQRPVTPAHGAPEHTFEHQKPGEEAKKPWLLNGRMSGYTTIPQMAGDSKSTTDITPPDCDCSHWVPTEARGVQHTTTQCKVAPCVAKTFKYIHDQQIAQAENMIKLETSVKDLQGNATAVCEPHLEAKAKARLPCSSGSTNVQNEVLKWLSESKNTKTSV